MPLCLTRFQNHRVFQVLTEVEKHRDAIFGCDSTGTLHSRVLKVVTLLERTLRTADPELVPISYLDSLVAPLDSFLMSLRLCSGELSLEGREHMEAQADAILVALVGIRALTGGAHQESQHRRSASGNTHELYAEDMLAYRQGVAAKLIGISLRSLRREIERKKIFPTGRFRVITRNELIRYLKGEVRASRRQRRVRRTDYKPVPLPKAAAVQHDEVQK
jgi:hypothetical protein